MNSTLEIIFGLFGGLAVFIFGMNMMSESLQNFASQAGPDGVTSILGLTGAIPILLGDNIGTTITALLACIGQPKDAKRTAAAHCIFNISGCFLFIWFIKPFAKCSPGLTAPFNQILHCISRMGNSCVNIADAAVGQVDLNYFIDTTEGEEEKTNDK